MKRSTHIWLYSISAFIDIVFIGCISITINTALEKYIFPGFSKIFVTVFLLYYLTSYSISDGKTLAKYLTGLKVEEINNNKLSLHNIITRDLLLKWFLGLFVPFYLLEHIFPVWSPVITIGIEAIFLLITFLFITFTRKSWWETFSKTRTKKDKPVSSARLVYSFAGIVMVFAITLITVLYPVYPFKKDTPHSLMTTFYHHYPVTNETTAYADYLKNKSRDPVEYIFELFEKYDIVVISERYHPEYTQYELFTRIITDKRFSQNVGNLFTETGSVSFQDELNKYLATPFTNEDELNKNTAILQRNSDGVHPIWTCTNHFDLLKTVNKLNTHLPDSSKINWYFSDLPVNWEKMTKENYLKGVSAFGRDSIMAATILKQYEQILLRKTRHKALVIMNTSHGYALHNYKGKTGIRWLDGSCTNYLAKTFPGKVSNVMMHSVSIFFTPVQKGKWETAFRINGNKAVAFNFENSPFGEDEWDSFFLVSASLKYKNIFTGLIFYSPLEAQIRKDGYPYMLDNFEDSLIRRSSCAGENELVTAKQIVAAYKKNPQSIFINSPAPYAMVTNAINFVLLPALIIITFIASSVFFILSLKKS